MPSGRTQCQRCRKASSTCYCARIRPFASTPRIIILIHPKESRKRIGTGRLTHLCLSNSLLIEGMDFSADERVLGVLADPTLWPVVLYPGKEAADLGGDGAAALKRSTPAGRELVVFIIDGTWYWARKMVQANPWLALLPQVRFTPPRASGYGKVRRQPRGHCFSTVEAAHFLIDRLGPASRDHDNMLEVFEAMVAQQLAFGGEK